MTPYSAADIIIRSVGQRMEITCSASARRAVAALSGRKDIDSLAPRLNRHCLFIRHDTNRTSLAGIKKHPVDAGFTPMNDYTSDRMGFALFDIPRGRNAQKPADDAIAFDGIDDVCVNPTMRKIAVTYLKDTTSGRKLRRQIK